MKAKSVLASRLGRKPTYAEIAEVVNLSASSVRIIILRNRNPFSLDLQVHEDGLKLKV
jgi:DNA-directed RNA polymerase sigma subunit (sigma70/sigma32)